MTSEETGGCRFCRRDVLRTIATAATSASLAGCNRLSGETERDVSLDRSNWITPAENDLEVAAGYNDLGTIYTHVEEMDSVLWKEEFAEWLGDPAPQADRDVTLPLVPKQELTDRSVAPVDSREYPSMAALTIDMTGDASDQHHLTVFQLPDSTSKEDVREPMSNMGGEFKQVNGVTVTKPKTTFDESGASAYSAYALEDDLLLNEAGSGGKITGNETDFHLQEVLERAGESPDLEDHPVTHVEDMDMVNSYGRPFLEDGSGPVSRSTGIDFGDETKKVVYEFEDAAAATQARERFGVSDDGKLVVRDGENKSTFTLRAVRYREIRQRGRGIVFEAAITDLEDTIKQGIPIWAYGLFGQ